MPNCTPTATGAPRPAGWPARRGGVRLFWLALAGLIALTALVASGALLGLEQRVLDALAELRRPGADALFLAITWLGSGYVLAPLALAGVALLGWRAGRDSALLLGVTYFGASASTWLFKIIMARPRPELHASIEGFVRTDWAFPSGHTTHAVAFALGVLLLWTRHRMPARVAVGALLLVLMTLVGVSRLYLQVHWPTDVAAGVLMALCWSGIALLLVHRLAPRRGRG